MYDVIIIGTGVAGYSAAIYSARFNLKTLLLGARLGGLLQDTHIVENYPAYKSISGFDLMEKFKEHVQAYKIDIKEERAIEAKKDKNFFTITTDKSSYKTKTIIIATGTKRRKLNIPGEKEFFGRGLSQCATCDAPLFKNKIVGVVGGSDSAAKESLFLADHAKQVYIIYRGDKIRPEPINKKRVNQNKKIRVINNTNIKEIKGDKFLTHVILDKPYKNSKEFKLDGLFIEIGHTVENEIPKQLKVKLNKKGEIIIDRDSKTNIKGVYAAGDCTNRDWKQAITGAAEGTLAAHSAYEHINNGESI